MTLARKATIAHICASVWVLPHAGIADILMPTMDGYEFVRHLRADPAIAATPVIFYTAHYHEPEARKLAAACGVSFVLTKPSEPDVVLETVHAALANAPPPALVFTDAAARKVGSLIVGEGNPNLMLRVFVQGGGCSGLQYGFEFDELLQDGDTCVENHGVKLLVDPMSFQYLNGAEIDYREGLDGAQFVIRNPNAATSCGCGSSFSA